MWHEPNRRERDTPYEAAACTAPKATERSLDCGAPALPERKTSTGRPSSGRPPAG